MTTRAHAPAMPPAERTIGQLVADSLRLYGNRFWSCLALGAGPAAIGLVAAQFERDVAFLVGAAGGMIVMTVSYVAASAIVSGTRLTRRTFGRAMLVGMIVYVPFPVLALTFVLPGIAWFAFLGLAVPAVVIEGAGFRSAFRRGIALGRADFVHAMGTIATLGLLVLLTGQVMAFVIRGSSGQALEIASFLAALVLTPLIFIGSAQLYYDQAARAAVKSKAPPTKEA